MTESDLGPLPTPEAVPPQLHPGGVDAVDDTGSQPLPHDLDPGDNPMLDDVVPDEIAERDDDKEQAPDGGAVSGEDDAPDEPPA